MNSPLTEPAFSQQVSHLFRKLFMRQKAEAAEAVEIQPAEASRPADIAPVSPPSEPIVASKLQLIGLERVRTVLGDRWAKLADRVRGIAQSIIEKNLLPGDVFEPHSDDGFLVLFAQLSQEDARFKSAAICRQIERHLIGCNLTDISDCAFEVVIIDAERASAGQGGDVPDNGGQVTLDRGENAAHGLGGAPSHSAVLTYESAGASNPPPQRDKAPTQVDDDEVTLVPEVALRGMQWKPIAPDNPGQDSFIGDETANVGAAKTRSPSPKGKLTDEQWLYRPVWDFQRSALMTFALIPFRLDAGVLVCDEDEEGEADDEYLFKRDTIALARCAHDLADLSNSGRRLPILAPIHYGTIVNNRRRTYFLDRLKNIAVERRKLISFELGRCPQDGLTLGLTNAIALMRSYGAHLAIRVGPDWRDLRPVERSGFVMATVDTSHSRLPEAARIPAFEKFAERTRAAKLDCAVWGLNTRSMVIAAAAAGIRHLAGSAIAPEVRSLSHALRFSPVDLYMRHMSHR
jgi:hypothetical protein